MSDTNTVSPLRLRMIQDMAGRKLNPHTQRGHIYSCKRFAAWLKRSPDTATPDEVRRFQLQRDEHLQPQWDHNRGAVLVSRHAASPRSGSRGLAHQGARAAATGAVPRGGQACFDHGDEPEGAGDADAGLWLRIAGGRGGAAASGRHRQRADDHPHLAIEGPQGPARDATAGGPEAVAAMVEGAADA